MGTLLVGITTVLTSGVHAEDAGAASGLLNVMQQIGGALGLAILVTAFGAATRTAHGAGHHVFTKGATTAFTVGAAFTACTILLALTMKARPDSAPEAPR